MLLRGHDALFVAFGAAAVAGDEGRSPVPWGLMMTIQAVTSPAVLIAAAAIAAAGPVGLVVAVRDARRRSRLSRRRTQSLTRQR